MQAQKMGLPRRITRLAAACRQIGGSSAALMWAVVVTRADPRCEGGLLNHGT